MATTSTEALTIAEAVDLFLAEKIAQDMSVRTIQTYRERCTCFTIWLAERRISGVEQLTPRIMIGYLTALQRRGYSPFTVASYFRGVKVFCAWLVKRKLLDNDPAADLHPRVPKDHRPASYTPAQITALLSACEGRDGLRDRALLLVLFDTGLRVSELCSMQRAMITGSGRFTVRGKGNKYREVQLSPYTQTVLTGYLGQRQDRQPCVWLGRQGPLTRLGVHRIVVRRAEAAGIRDQVRRLVHSARATFARAFLKGGGDLKSLADLLGHAGLEMAAFYGQSDKDELMERKLAINPLAVLLPETRDL